MSSNGYPKNLRLQAFKFLNYKTAGEITEEIYELQIKLQI